MLPMVFSWLGKSSTDADRCLLMTRSMMCRCRCP
jgi:hypothetical protein